MSKAKAKTIQILLDEGTLDGIICMVSSSWSSGELYSAPRESAEKLITSDACNKYGVYLLLSDNQVYIGQSSDLANRIKQHIIGKDWWEQVIVLTTADDSFDRSDIDFLEATLINKVFENDFIECDNKNKGNPIKVDRFKRVTLDQYLEEAFFLLELIGIDIFTEKIRQKQSLLPKINEPSEQQREIRAKREAKAFIEDAGYKFVNYTNYASLQEDNQFFWINPKTEAIFADWDIILNDHDNNELILITVPANSISINSLHGDNNLKIRNDKPYYFDLRIDKETLIDNFSKYDFSKHVVKRFSY